MTKIELISKVAEIAEITKKDSDKLVNTVLDIIKDELSEGKEVALTGFGRFSVKERAARIGVNPQNPTEKIQIAACKAPTFKASKNLKEAVNS